MPDNAMIVPSCRPMAGLRPSTAATRATSAQADAFHGLPEGVTRWRLSAALRAAAQHLDLTPMMLRLLEYYIDLTWDTDWAPSSEPVIIRPLVETATALGRTERQIRNVERALVERGLLGWRDSGNHHRRGRRDYKTGKLLYGFGPTLAPLGLRAAEIIALAESARRESIALGRLRIAIAALRRHLRAHLAVATDAAVDQVIIDEAIAVLQTVPARLKASDGIDRLTRWHEALKTAAQRLDASLSTENVVTEQAPPGKVTAQAEISSVSYTETKSLYPINGTSTHLREIQPRQDFRTAKNPDIGLIQQCIASDGEKNGWESKGNWQDLIATMQERVVMLDIDQASWANACATLGRRSAAICAIILENRLSRQDATEVQNPRAYFNALIRRGLHDRLDMTSSLRGIARRKSCHRAKKSDNGHQGHAHRYDALNASHRSAINDYSAFST